MAYGDWMKWYPIQAGADICRGKPQTSSSPSTKSSIKKEEIKPVLEKTDLVSDTEDAAEVLNAIVTSLVSKTASF